MFNGWQYLSPSDRELILKGVDDGKAYGGPFHMEFNWTNACNSNCFFCLNPHLHNSKAIPWDRARALLEQARDLGLRSIRLAGGGEPLAHPDKVKIFDWLSGNGVALDNLNTNGIALDEKVTEALASCDVSEIRVSLNYCNAGQYAQAMGLDQAVFKQVCANIERLNALRRSWKRFGTIEVQFFVYKGTEHLLKEMYALGRSLGADYIKFRTLNGVDPKYSITLADQDSLFKDIRSIFELDKKEQRVRFQFSSMPGFKKMIIGLLKEFKYDSFLNQAGFYSKVRDDQRFCYIGWYSMTVDGNESVYPCYQFLPYAAIPPLDSLEGKTLKEVWHGPRFEQLRKEIRHFMLHKAPYPRTDDKGEVLMGCCSTHKDCSIGGGMPDDEFLIQADARLDALRRKTVEK